MDAAKVLEGTTHSRSAGAPSSRLRRFHLPHWVNLLTHCGFYKYVVSMVSTIIYIIYPSSAFKTEYLAAVLNIYAVKAEDLLCWKKATGASNLLVEFAWKHGPQKGHTRCACVWSWSHLPLTRTYISRATSPVRSLMLLRFIEQHLRISNLVLVS